LVPGTAKIAFMMKTYNGLSDNEIGQWLSNLHYVSIISTDNKFDITFMNVSVLYYFVSKHYNCNIYINNL